MDKKYTPMKHLSAFIIVILLLANTPFLHAQSKLSPRNANYDIDVTLDHEKRTLNGSLVLHWQNLSPDTIDELHFHTYLNAFKNTKSTFMKESGGQLRGDYIDTESGENPWGWTHIESMNDADGNQLTWEYIQPDDANKDDQTVVKANLKKVILPYQTTKIRIKFVAKLPKVFARTGYTDEFYLVGQWFPKIGVYEPKGMRGRKESGWNCHQFHANSEFYADFGVYNVSITVPNEFIVGATGVLMEKTQAGTQATTYTFKAEDVVDFAWTASPLFKVGKAKWKNTDITILLQPEHFDQLERHHKSLIAALEYFDQHLGEYPYPSVTVVDPPFDAGGAGGMEYPMFITAGTHAFMPEGIRMPEMVTVHEFGHQYFMGILATNEFEEAWMDEGMNSYFETRIMDETYGENTGMIDWFGIEIPDVMFSRSGYAGSTAKRVAASKQTSWSYTAGGYGVLSYNKPATMLNTLRGYVGQKTMDDIFRAFFDQWKFKHPSTEDFIAVANQIIAKKEKCILGQNLNGFFEQFLYGTNVCDYKVASISNKPMYSASGMFDNGNKLQQQTGTREKGKYKCTTTLVRQGDATLPVEVKVMFDDGSIELFWWDGQAGAKQFTFEKEAKIQSVQIDPNRRNLMDVNFTNNSKTLRPDKATTWKLTTKFLYWVQHIMQFLAVLV